MLNSQKYHKQSVHKTKLSLLELIAIRKHANWTESYPCFRRRKSGKDLYKRVVNLSFKVRFTRLRVWN